MLRSIVTIQRQGARRKVDRGVVGFRAPNINDAKGHCLYVPSACNSLGLGEDGLHHEGPMRCRFLSTAAVSGYSRINVRTSIRSSEPSLASIATGTKHLYCHQQVRHKVFVSKHNTLNVTAAQILEQCTHHGVSPHETRTTHSHVVLKECPFCPKPTNGKVDNEYKLYVSVGGGAYFCHRCGASGSWYDFKMKLGGYDIVRAGGESASAPQPAAASRAGGTASMRASSSSYSSGIENDNAKSQCLPMPPRKLSAMYVDNLEQEPAGVLEYLTNERGLAAHTLRKYGVGRAVYKFPSKAPNSSSRYVDAECVTFPWIMRASQIAEQESLRGATFSWTKDLEVTSEREEELDQQKEDPSQPSEQEETPSTVNDPFLCRRIKVRAVDNKGWQRLDPPGGGWGLFGFHTVPEEATSIVITEGEYDAMAVYQATQMPAVSLPSGCRNLPVEVLPLLEKFEKVYLWMDNDAPGQEGAEKFAKKIGVNRCYIVKPKMVENAPKDANEALLKENCNMQEMLDAASVLPHERITQFAELRSMVLHEITHPDKYVGVPVPSLPMFTGLVKGFRRGELTVLTGPTGSGKTTFLGQLSLDFAEQGVNTLWGSFEIKNTRLMHKLLQQYSREPLPVGKPDMAEALDALADRFETLPLYFMKFHGGSEVEAVLDAMDYAAYVHDVEHIILDNLQFMITRDTGKGSFDKFDIQDIAVEKFRKFATERNVHVTLVVHPRKEAEGTKLGISSIYGSAKATQEADTVLILQSDGRRKYVEVKKNRFDGSLGFSPLHFQRSSGRYLEAPEAGINQHASSGNESAILGARVTAKLEPKASAGSDVLDPHNYYAARN